VEPSKGEVNAQQKPLQKLGGVQVSVKKKNQCATPRVKEDIKKNPHLHLARGGEKGQSDTAGRVVWRSFTTLRKPQGAKNLSAWGGKAALGHLFGNMKKGLWRPQAA